MGKIIGICGARGTGRRTAAWLLAKTLEEQRSGTSYEKFQALYECWVKLVIIDPSEACSTDHVILDSFGEHILDQIKQFVPSLIEYDLHDEAVTDNNWINPSTFDVVNMRPDVIMNPQEYLDKINNHICLPFEIFMTISDFILYFARDVMKTYFGDSVWLNVARYTASAAGSSDSRIYWDCKTQAELNYIDKSNGTIIELRNADRAMNGGYRDISALDPDFILDTVMGLERCAESFWNIATQIRNKD